MPRMNTMPIPNSSATDSHRVERGVVGHVDEGRDGEPREDHGLEGYEHVLDGLGRLHSAVGDVAGEGNEHERRRDVHREIQGGLRCRGIVQELREQREKEVHRDGGEVG